MEWSGTETKTEIGGHTSRQRVGNTVRKVPWPQTAAAACP